MKVIENVIDREVVVVEVASSELGDSFASYGDSFTLSDIIITDIDCTLEALARMIMSMKLISVNNKVRNNIAQY